MNEPWTDEELHAIWREVMSESDRGCVLLCAAHLDRGLEKLIRLKFHSFTTIPKSTDNDIDKILSDYPLAPLLSFAARARIAYLLGVINKDMSASLRQFAKLRNVYAHRDDAPPLTEKTIVPILDARTPDYQKHLQGMLDAMHSTQEIMKKTSHSKGRLALIAVAAMLSIELKMIRGAVFTHADQARQIPEKSQGPQ